MYLDDNVKIKIHPQQKYQFAMNRYAYVNGLFSVGT